MGLLCCKGTGFLELVLNWTQGKMVCSFDQLVAPKNISNVFFAVRENVMWEEAK